MLPDAAGEIYGQGNILGTVSQSAGVPTGAIIESGSNANGEFVKYADGTMICTRIEDVGTPTTLNSDFNNLSSFSLPATYVGDYTVAAAVGVGTNSAPLRGKYSISCRQDANLWGRLCLTRHGTSTGDQIVTVSLTAIGRWF